MTNQDRRKQLRANYDENPPEAGVYRIVNTSTGKMLVGSTMNLPSMTSKLAFARTTKRASALDLRLKADAAMYGIEVFEVEILDTFEPAPGATPAETRQGLAELEALWCEKVAPDFLD
jgi:hypothetical protein